MSLVNQKKMSLTNWMSKLCMRQAIMELYEVYNFSSSLLVFFTQYSGARDTTNTKGGLKMS